MVWLEAEIYLIQLSEASDEKAGAGHEHQRGCYLSDNEQITEMSTSRAATGLVFQFGVKIDAGKLKGWYQTEEEASE
jgi:hypothetical protein